MWWRALGVAVVLLCVGVAGGYAVADRSADEPAEQRHARAGAGGVAGRAHAAGADRSCPTRTTEPLAARPAQPRPIDLRVSRRAAGRHGGHPRRLAAEPGRRHEHVELRQAGQPDQHLHACGSASCAAQNVSIAGAKAGRIAALEEADSQRRASRTSTVTDRDRRHLRGDLHRRRLPPRDDGEVGLVRREPRVRLGAAVTGRTVDEEGLRDLLSPDHRLDAGAAGRAAHQRQGRGALDPVGLDVVEDLVGGGRGRRCGSGPTAGCWRRPGRPARR